jgi:factor associated with neutral sphingomyelinase activation
LNDVKNFRDLSKPIGALNPKKLKTSKDTYHELKDQGEEYPHMYGSFYSYPFIVLYYLTRTHPTHFLRLQGGDFDKADRLFFSMKETWGSSYNPGQDVKELIPEFYSSDGEFLKNINMLVLGKTQNDIEVNDVILPKWALSGRHFVSVLRSALESEIVSNTLNHWIDLIFGYKQRDESALEADNVYSSLRYDHNIHLLLEASESTRESYLASILDFGQAPIQLFQDPHPKKRTSKMVLNNDQLSNKSEYFIHVHKLKGERMKIEKKYEKMRRDKENELDKIRCTLSDKEKVFNEQIIEITE